MVLLIVEMELMQMLFHNVNMLHLLGSIVVAVVGFGIVLDLVLAVVAVISFLLLSWVMKKSQGKLVKLQAFELAN
jgi:hypothetical protein